MEWLLYGSEPAMRTKGQKKAVIPDIRVWQLSFLFVVLIC